MKHTKGWGIWVLAIFIFTCPVMAGAASAHSGCCGTEPSVGIKVFDALLVRPVWLVGSIVSTAVFIGISPLAGAIGIGEPLGHAMVEAPWRFTHSRCLGRFDAYKDGEPITVAHFQ